MTTQAEVAAKDFDRFKRALLTDTVEAEFPGALVESETVNPSTARVKVSFSDGSKWMPFEISVT